MTVETTAVTAAIWIEFMTQVMKGMDPSFSKSSAKFLVSQCLGTSDDEASDPVGSKALMTTM